MTTYGYIRVSTVEQNIERQIEAMRREGIAPEHLFIDKASGKNFERPEYQRMMQTVQRGDKIVVDSLDRLGRNYDGLIEAWRHLTRDCGVDIKALDLAFMDSESFRRMDDIGRMIEDMLLSVLAWSAANERDKMLRRQAEGIAVAKAKGVYTGRKPTEFAPETLEAANEALKRDGKSAAARVLGVDRSTIYRMIKDGRLAA